MVNDVRLRVARRAVRIATAVVLGLAPVCLAAGQGEVLSEDWYALYLAGQKAGHVHERVRQMTYGGAPAYESEIQQQIALARGRTAIQIRIDTNVLEDADGHLIRYESSMGQGPMVRKTRGEVKNGTLVITDVSTGTQRRIPAPTALCPWGLHRLMQEKGYEPGQKYTVKGFVPEFPERDVTLTVKVVGKEEVPFFEVTKYLTRCDVEQSILPGMPTSQWVDDEGTVWRTVASLAPGLSFETLKVSRAMALATNDPADILGATVVQCKPPIRNPRELRRLEAVVIKGSASTRIDLPSDGQQQVEARPDGLHVTVTRAEGDPAKSYRLPYQGTEYAELTKPSRWLETEDPLIVEMAQEALAGETDALKATRLIETYVRDRITRKDLSVGLATAAETARQLRGDCTEHALLVAGLARAAGMPSRGVGGLAYAPSLPGNPQGGFGYHMWAEVYVGEWLPVDAALGGHDATHLVIGRDDLTGLSDLLELSGAIGRVLGRIRVRVLDTEY